MMYLKVSYWCLVQGWSEGVASGAAALNVFPKAPNLLKFLNRVVFFDAYLLKYLKWFIQLLRSIGTPRPTLLLFVSELMPKSL